MLGPFGNWFGMTEEIDQCSEQCVCASVFGIMPGVVQSAMWKHPLQTMIGRQHQPYVGGFDVSIWLLASLR
jgi:hypothetical protein